MKRYRCHKCEELVYEKDVIIQYRDGAGFSGGDTRAFCDSCYVKSFRINI